MAYLYTNVEGYGDHRVEDDGVGEEDEQGYHSCSQGRVLQNREKMMLQTG